MNLFQNLLFGKGEKGSSGPTEDWGTDHREHPLVVVLGRTGSGKTTFVKNLTRRSDVQVSSGLGTGTWETSEYFLVVNDQAIILLDTPGFDSILQTNLDTIEDLQHYINQNYQGKHIDAILYLHNISAPRLSGSSRAGLEILQCLRGDATSSARIAIVTTFWDKVSPEEGKQRKMELCETPDVLQYLDDGAILVDMPRTRSDKLHLIADLLASSNKPHVSSYCSEVPGSFPSAGPVPTPPQKKASTNNQPQTKASTANRNGDFETTMSLNALTQLVTAQENAFAKREAALAARERMVNDAEKQNQDAVDRLRQQFEVRLKSQTKEFELALSSATNRCDELEKLLDDTLKLHQRQLRIDTQKEHEIADLKCAQSQMYMAGQLQFVTRLPEFFEKLATVIEADGKGEFELFDSLVLRRCDVCRQARTGEKYSCEIVDCAAKSFRRFSNFLFPTDTPSYYVCEACYHSGQRCPGRHELQQEKLGKKSLRGCTFYPDDAGFRCSVCSKKAYGFFAHCCLCDNDTFLLCAPCLMIEPTGGRLCRNLDHNIGVGSVCLPALHFESG